MASALQNRIVGSIVFIALIVIFLPDLLNGKKNDYQDTIQSIPPSPKVKPIEPIQQLPNNAFNQQMQQANSPILEEESADVIFVDNAINHIEDSAGNNAEANTQANTQAKTPAITSTDPTLNLNSQTGDQVEKTAKAQSVIKPNYQKPAWVIQLGSFKHTKNIQNLMTKLKQEGYICFTQPVQTRSGQLTKVYIGPDLDKAALEKMLPDLKKLTNLSGKLAVFNPTNN